MALAWVMATIVAITISTAAVSSVRSEVTDTPTALGVSASPLASSEDETQSAPSLVDPRTNKRADDRADGSSALERIPETATSAPLRVEETTTTAEPQGKYVDPDESPAGTPSSPQEVHSTANAPASVDGSPDNPPSRSAISTTTTTSPDEPEVDSYTRVISTDGGAISVLVTGDNVNFKRGFARDGWKLDLADSGPSAVRVRYQRNDAPDITVRIDARVVSGELVVMIFRSQ